MAKARPKEAAIYTVQTFSGDAEVWISCFPQQIWSMSKSRASKQNGYFAAVSRQRNDVYKTQRGKKKRK